MKAVFTRFTPGFQFASVAVLIAAAAAIGTFAQKLPRPNFSGTWTMEKSGTSFDPSERNLIIERTAPALSELTLTISHDGNDIKILRKFTFADKLQEQNLEYHTDGRGEVNPTISSSKRTLHTRTRWKDNRLVIKFDPSAVSTSGQPLVANRQIEWRVTDGGARLIETETTHFQQSSMVDSSVSASDLRQPSIVPPTITLRRVYKKVS